MRLTPPWTAYLNGRDLDGLSFRQLHAVAEAADCDLRGFAPDAGSLVLLAMVMDRLNEVNDRRPAGDRCACWACHDPFPIDGEALEL